MPTYALLQNNKVQHVFVADSVDSLGDAGILYDVLDITTLDPRPGVGHTLKDGVWNYPRQVGETTSGVQLSIENIVEVSDSSDSKGKSK